MCNRARLDHDPETIFGAGKWWLDKLRDNRFDPNELRPRNRAYVVREEDGYRGIDVMSWDVLGGQAAWPMTNVRNLALPQWREVAKDLDKPGRRWTIRWRSGRQSDLHPLLTTHGF